jgi:hypothetical protein
MPKMPARPAFSGFAMPKLAMPTWLTPRTGIMGGVALVVFLNFTHHLPFVN